MSPSSAEPAPQPSETPPVPAATPPVPEETAVPEPEAEPVPDTALPPEPVAAPPVQVTPEQGLPMELLLAALAFVLVALGGGYYLYRRRKGGGELTSSLSRRPAVQPPEEPVAAAGVVASLSTAPQTSREELERLDETVGEERADLGMPLAPPPPAPRSESLRMDDTLGMTGPLPDNGQTAQFRADPNATQVMEPVSAATAKLAEKVDFDVTGQFESDTVSINLDTNDPVAEADFHLAYGLYDEAALLLQQAAEKDPGNTAVRVKLAEVYFAAGKPAEFEQTAEPLKNELPAAEWQKLAILGQQICPESPVFQDAGGGDLGGAVDLNFDEPAPAAPAASPVPAPARDAGGDAGGGVLDFKLEDFELPSQPEPAATDKPASTPGSSVLEFNLDVPEIKAGIGASPEPEPKAQQSPEPEEPKLELDLGAFDLGSPDLPPPPPAKPKPAAGDGEMKLEDFDVAADSAAIGADDAAGTKLDLARAYLDMGDKDMTKSLLEEVLVQGNAQQKQEAQALMGRLG
jgi:pilus assembly protein FimV